MAADEMQAADNTSARYSTAELALRLDQAWKVLNLNQELIRAADQKIYLLIVMSTLLVTYVSSNLVQIMLRGLLQRVVLIVFLLAVAAFFYFALSTVVSRNSRQDNKVGAVPQVVFFGDIATRASAQHYMQAFRSTDMHAMFDDICQQIFDVATIARDKYRCYRRAWSALLVEVTLFLLLQFSVAL